MIWYVAGIGTAGSATVIPVAVKDVTDTGLPPNVTTGALYVPKLPTRLSVVPDEEALVTAACEAAGLSSVVTANDNKIFTRKAAPPVSEVGPRVNRDAAPFHTLSVGSPCEQLDATTSTSANRCDPPKEAALSTSCNGGARSGRRARAACPSCQALSQVGTASTGNNLGATLWTDGVLATPMDWSPGPLKRCPACDATSGSVMRASSGPTRTGTG